MEEPPLKQSLSSKSKPFYSIDVYDLLFMLAIIIPLALRSLPQQCCSYIKLFRVLNFTWLCIGFHLTLCDSFHHQNHLKRSPTWVVHSIALRVPSLHPQHGKKRKKEKENFKNAISVPKVQLFFISIPLELFVLSRDKPSTSHRSPLPSRMTSNTYKATLRIVHDIEWYSASVWSPKKKKGLLNLMLALNQPSF